MRPARPMRVCWSIISVPARLQRVEITLDVVDLEADVVQALALAVEVARDAGVRDDRLEQLDLAVAEREQRGLHALLLRSSAVLWTCRPSVSR